MKLARAQEKVLRILGSSPVSYHNLAAQVLVNRKKGVDQVVAWFDTAPTEERSLEVIACVLHCDPRSFPALFKALVQPIFVEKVVRNSLPLAALQTGYWRLFYLRTIMKLAAAFRAANCLMDDADNHDLIDDCLELVHRIILVRPEWVSLVDRNFFETKECRRAEGLLQTELKSCALQMEGVVEDVACEIAENRREVMGWQLGRIGADILDVFSYAKFKRHTPEQRALYLIPTDIHWFTAPDEQLGVVDYSYPSARKALAKMRKVINYKYEGQAEIPPGTILTAKSFVARS